MFFTTHVIVGAVLGAHRKPAAAFGLGVLSHFVLDAVPHWGTDGDHDEFMRVAVPDGLGGLAALVALAMLSPPGSRRSVLAGAMGGATPDLEKPFEEITGRLLWPRPVRWFHMVIQRESPKRMRQELGTLTAVTLFGAAYLALLRSASPPASPHAVS